LSLFTLHGAVFLSLKTDGDVRAASRRVATRVGVAAVALAAGFLIWTQASYGRGATDITAAVAAVCLVGSLLANLRRREGWAFVATAATIMLAVVTLFGDLWPNVMPSSTSSAFNLTVHNASSSPYTLGVMTWVALLATPVVLIYQGWTYWVFRKRITGRVATAP
jgi:cytochrome d ubiquinol oxidase subunit II